MLKNDLTLHLTQEIPAKAEVVWDVLTRPELVKQYMFGADLKTSWKVGDPIFFEGEYEGVEYRDGGTVLEFEPYTSISYSYWSSFSQLPDTPENRSIITFKLTPQRDSLQLEVIQAGFVSEESMNHSTHMWRSALNLISELSQSRGNTSQ